MEKSDDAGTLCKNIFKNGEGTITKEKYTQAWVNLINRLERDKAVTLSGKP